MLTNVADELGLTVDELEAQLETEGGLMAVLLARGLSFEDARELLLEVRTETVQEAVELGLIDGEHAEWMLERVQRPGSHESGMWSQGFRPYRSSGERPACRVDS